MRNCFICFDSEIEWLLSYSILRVFCLFGTTAYIICVIAAPLGLLHWLPKSTYNSEHSDKLKFFLKLLLSTSAWTVILTGERKHCVCSFNLLLKINITSQFINSGHIILYSKLYFIDLCRLIFSLAPLPPPINNPETYY